MVKSRFSQSYTLLPPVGGWNAKDPIAGMPEQDAIHLINVFPETTSCRLRNGFREHADITGGNSITYTLAEYVGVSGSAKLIAVNNNKFWDVTTYSGAPTDITGALTVTESKYQYTSFRTSGNSYLVFCNGANAPKIYEGTTLADMALTGVTQANLIQPTVYKRRLYFTEKETTKIWYPAIDAIAGACTAFDVGTILTKGGYIMWCDSWSGNYGSGLATVFVMCSSEGEILVYEGDNPGDSSWRLIGHYYVGKPLGRRSFLNFEADLLVLTQEGIVPLSKVINNEFNQNVKKVSDKIQDVFNRAARDYFNNFGWEALFYPNKHQLLVNIPVSETRADQYVMNTLTGAWCQYFGMNAATWCLLDGKPYFGNLSSNDISEWDNPLIQSDNGNFILCDIKQAFTLFGDPTSIKKMNQARPILRTSSGVQFLYDVDMDYANNPITSTLEVEGVSSSSWNSSPWNTTPWASSTENVVADWYGIRGLGRAASLKVKANFKNVGFELLANHIIYETGGVT